MTYRDESAPADDDLDAPSTRRKRRDGEREAAHRALYAASSRSSTPLRVVDGGAPLFRTRRDMRESASRLARDLPVIVEHPAAAANEARSEAETRTAPRQDGRRAPRPDAKRPSAESTPSTTPTSRRARRLEAAAIERRGSASDASAPSSSPSERRAATQPPMPAGATTEPPAVPQRRDDPAQASGPGAPGSSAAARLVGESTAPSTVAREQVDASPSPRAMTRAERRAAQAASSDAVVAAVATVLGGPREDVASTPVRSPLHREPRPPKPAMLAARRPLAHTPVARPSSRAGSRGARKAVQRLAAAGVILSIASFVAVTSLPAQAFSPEEPTSTTGAYGDVEVEQQLDVTTGSGPHGTEEVTAVLTRDDFGVDDALASARMSADELASLQAIADAEDIGPYYGGDPAMPGVWAQLGTTYTQSPFPSLAEVPVSSGFGYRWGSFHGGVDLIPGAGTPVFPIANGVVVATWQGNNPGGGGYEVIVEHNIDGQYFQSWYPHMQAGSILVEPGQVVDITTQLGQVGSTGHSTGPHLHLEIKNGDYISVDPLVWLSTREQILEP